MIIERGIVNMKNKKLVITLCISLIIVTLAFAISIIKLSSVIKEKSQYKIEFISMNKLNPIQAGKYSPTSNATITNNGLSVDLSFDLYTPNDEITYLIKIKNTGKVAGKITNLIALPDYFNDDNTRLTIAPATIDINNIIGKELSPNEETTLKVTARYNYTKKKLQAINIPIQLSLLTESI